MTDNTNPNPNSTVTSALDSLVGTGKKFQTPEDLAAGKIESDKFIAQLTNENKELRGLVTSQDDRVRKLESKISILDRLSGNPNTDGNPIVPKVEPALEPQAKGLTEEDVLKVVERAKLNEAAARNRLEVDGVLGKKFGNEAGAFLLQKAGELGIAPDDLKALAMTSPKAFYNMLGINPNANSTGTVYTGTGKGAVHSETPIRNAAYYEGIKQKVGSRAYVMDKSLQLQLHKDMTQMGEAFFA